jgi:CheY-like chemotaxis protein
VPSGLSESALLTLLRDQCSQVGEIIDIKLMPSLSEGRLVFVQMRTKTQAYELSQTLGQTVFGDVVAIQLTYAAEIPDDVEQARKSAQLMDQKSLRVLVVDDDAGAATALTRLLRALGHSVYVSHAAKEALELAVVGRPNLILHDIIMPEMDGYEAARRLRAIPTLARTLLIACSGLIDEQKAREAGFNGWLPKPIAQGDLQKIITIALERATNDSQDFGIAAWPKQPN